MGVVCCLWLVVARMLLRVACSLCLDCCVLLLCVLLFVLLFDVCVCVVCWLLLFLVC